MPQQDQPKKPNLGQRVDQVESDVADIRQRYTVDTDALNQRLNRTDRTAKVNANRHDRLARMMQRSIEELSTRVAEDHDVVVTLQQRIARLEELTRDGLRMNLAASIAGFTEDEIREILAIQAQEDLSDSAVVTGMFGSINWLRSNVNTLIDTVAETRGIVNEHTSQIGSLQSDMQATAAVSASAHARMDSQQTPNRVFAIAGLIGLVAGIIWAMIDFDQINTLQSDGTTRLVDQFPDHPVAAIMFGLGVAMLVGFFLSAANRTRSSAHATADAGAMARVRRISTDRPAAPVPPPATDITQPQPTVAPATDNQSTPPVPLQQTQANAGAHAHAGHNH